MRVALDVTPAHAGNTGVSRYTRELTAALARAEVETAPFSIGRGPAAGLLPGRTRHVGVPLRIVHGAWRLAGSPRAERLAGPGPFDLVHSLDLVAPPSRLPVVMTIHDTAAVDHPEWHSARAVYLQRWRLSQAVDAAAVLVNSPATAADAVRHGVDPARITVSPLGATGWPPARPVPELEGVGPGYVLTIGEVHPRKDIPTLALALGRLGDPAPVLVVAGPTGADEARLRGAAQGTGLRLVRVDTPDDAGLAALYAGAGLLAAPSRAEGFGLPVLEAMAAGVPVVASDLPALAELTEGAAALVTPGDVEAWAETLGTVLADADRRQVMGERGRLRAAGFTWDGTAAATLEAYRAALEGRP